jgi:N-acetyl-anhydromuramyl-L-alanine amidase AmpD
VSVWYPAAEQYFAPSWKINGVINRSEGVVLHSMEGSYSGALTVLMSNSQASWHFSVLKDGRVIQHYPTTAACWHAGGPVSNNKFIGIEHEGRVGEALTPEQLASSVGLVRWIAQEEGWQMARHVTMFEHNEVYNTACPSGRIPWEAYVTNDPNREDNYDTGLTRIRLEDMLRILRDEHRHAEGDPQVLHDIIDGKR